MRDSIFKPRFQVGMYHTRWKRPYIFGRIPHFDSTNYLTLISRSFSTIFKYQTFSVVWVERNLYFGRPASWLHAVMRIMIEHCSFRSTKFDQIWARFSFSKIFFVAFFNWYCLVMPVAAFSIISSTTIFLGDVIVYNWWISGLTEVLKILRTVILHWLYMSEIEQKPIPSYDLGNFKWLMLPLIGIWNHFRIYLEINESIFECAQLTLRPRIICKSFFL